MSADVCRNPVFILTASRSGSTLLRFILDTHPEFACPPETMIASACVPLLRSWDILENAGSGRQRLVTEPVTLPSDAADLVRGMVDRLYGRYLARRGKPRWCDKSLDSVLAAELVAEIYPDAQFICLYRHCMDVIASGIEACPWGVTRFGFDEYVAKNPGNSVAAIGAYWADWARLQLEFEKAHPDRCRRLRYEDLAAAPEETMAGLLEFLSAAPMPGISSACFAIPHEGDGPGDEKIWFTSKVSTDTVGRGIAVPAEALPGDLADVINQFLAELGYRSIGPDWNSARGLVDPRLPGTGPGIASDRDPGRDHPVAAALRDRLSSRGGGDQLGPAARWPAVAGQTVTLVVTGDHGQGEVNWTFDGPGAPSPAETPAETPAQTPAQTPAGSPVASPEPVATLIAAAEVWQGLLDGRANIITEIRNGRLRCVNRRDGHRLRSDELHAVSWLLGIPQVPLAQPIPQ